MKKFIFETADQRGNWMDIAEPDGDIECHLRVGNGKRIYVGIDIPQAAIDAIVKHFGGSAKKRRVKK